MKSVLMALTTVCTISSCFAFDPSVIVCEGKLHAANGKTETHVFEGQETIADRLTIASKIAAFIKFEIGYLNGSSTLRIRPVNRTHSFIIGPSVTSEGLLSANNHVSASLEMPIGTGIANSEIDHSPVRAASLKCYLR